MDMTEAGSKRKLQLQELEELRLAAYENSRISKEKTKVAHDKLIAKRISTWVGPFVVTHVFPYGAVEIMDESTTKKLTVNGQRLKQFYEDFTEHTVEELSLLDLPPT
ncbi:uncharacterized protein LOC127808558 [Diospyros lotus]|uniref:uncharacterized protein LOC127808558 n=1 Tax=Diospyros lotus TaxID=55363 RepID=UPI00224E1448|nr:uncharacterized protein LOC127808558 [Diospyros lotus]